MQGFSHISDIIRKKRLSLHKTQLEVAKIAGMDPSFWSRLEGGKIANPSLETLSKVATALGITVRELEEVQSEPKPINLYPLLVAISKSQCKEVTFDDLLFIIEVQKGLSDTVSVELLEALMNNRKNSPHHPKTERP